MNDTSTVGKMSKTLKSLQSILKPTCELLISKYADICDFEAVMCILQNIDNKNPIWFYSSKVNVYDEATILHWAAKFGQLSVIQYVCRFEDEKNPCDIWGVTPIHLAAENGHLEIVQYLMKYLTNDKNPKSYGCTSVLDMAARGGHLEVFKYLQPFSNSRELRANNGLYLLLENSDT